MRLNKVFRKVVVLSVVMCVFSAILRAGQQIIYPCEDGYVVTAGGGLGCNPFLKFDISSIPTDKTIDSVFLEVYVWQVDTPWTGNVNFWNVNNQTWTESTPPGTLWNFLTSDSVFQSAGFGMEMGWTRSIDLIPIFLRDYNMAHTYCSIKMKDPDDITLHPAPFPLDSNDTLMLGNDAFGDWYIYFYPHEHTGDKNIPKLVVYSKEFGVEYQDDKTNCLLLQNHPNPFTHTTVIRFQVPGASENLKPNTYNLTPITLKIYDLTGRLVRSLPTHDSRLTTHEITWDGRDNVGNRLPSGIYFCSLKTDKNQLIRKLLLL